MTGAPVMATEHDDYGEHVASVVRRLARSGDSRMRELREWLATQSLLGLDDLEQVMANKAVKDRHKVHGEGCNWPAIPPGELTCCGLMATSLLNAAADAMRKETRSRSKRREDRGSPVAVDPAAFTGTLPESELRSIHHDLAQASAGLEREAQAVSDAATKVEQAVKVLTADQFDAAVAFGVLGLQGDAAGQWLGIPTRTATDRWLRARLRMLAALTGPEAD